MTLNEGDTLLGFGLDAYMWTIWRDFVKLPPVKKISNFYHEIWVGESSMFTCGTATVLQVCKNDSDVCSSV